MRAYALLLISKLYKPFGKGECIICGIFGAISIDGNKPDLDILEHLAILNERRGKDSFGMLAENSFIKRKGKISKQYPAAWVEHNDESRYMLCHTRHATRGAKTRKNAHPFFYSKKHEVAGIHNGMVPAPMTYEVDSQWIFDRLSQFGLDGLNEVGGYWGLAFVMDGETYLAAYDQELSVCELDGVLYFSSDVYHLEEVIDIACYGRSDCNDVECIELDNVIVRVNKDGSFTTVDLEPKDYYEYKDYMYEWEEKEGTSTDWITEWEYDSHRMSEDDWQLYQELETI